MPLAYHHVSLYHEGILSAQPFTLPGDGRKLFFDICPSGTLRKSIYVVIDGKLADTSFSNGSRIETPIRGLQRILKSPHEAFALVVDKTEFPLPTLDLTLNPIPVTYRDGQRSVLRLSCSVNASIWARDPQRLAERYADGRLSTPEDAASAALRGATLRLAVDQLPTALREVAPHEALGRLDSLSLDLARRAAEEVEREHPWCGVHTCDVLFQILNEEEVIERTNTGWKDSRETMLALRGAILSTFGASPLPMEVSQLLQSYLTSNPGLSPGEITTFCQDIHGLWQRTSPAAMITAIRALGMLPAAKGGP